MVIVTAEFKEGDQIAFCCFYINCALRGIKFKVKAYYKLSDTLFFIVKMKQLFQTFDSAFHFKFYCVLKCVNHRQCNHSKKNTILRII